MYRKFVYFIVAIVYAGTFLFAEIHFVKGEKTVVDELYVLSLVELLSNPEKYDGKKIHVQGYLVYQFECSALFMTRDHADHRLRTYALWVDYQGSTFDLPKDRRIVRNKYVSLVGKFNMNKHGHLGSYSGTIEEVEKVLIAEKARK